MKKSLLIILCTLMSLMSWAQNRADGTAEPYAVLKGDTLLTFYYDDQKATRNGMDIGPFSSATARGWHSARETITSVVFDDSFANYDALTSMNMWFYGLTHLTSVTGISNLNTANVTSFRSTFSGCSSLTSLDLSSLNTSKVLEMNFMFEGCSSLTDLKVGFSTESVTTMANMFLGCSSLTTLDLSTFNTASVKSSMDYMFSSCSALTTIYVSDLWTTTNVTTGNEMFNACQNLVGGQGTSFSTSHRALDYAHIDGGENNPGYFTDKNAAGTFDIRVSVYGNGEVSVGNLPDVIVDGKSAVASVDAGGSLEMFFFPGEGYQLDSLMVDGINVTADVVPATEQSAASYTLNNINAVHNVITFFGEKASYNEAYAVLVSEDGGNIMYATLYYDGNKANHTEGFAVVGLDEMLQNQAWMMNRGSIQTVTFDESFANCNPTSTAYWFAFCNSLTAINGLQYLNTEYVTNMEYMFHMCPALTSIDLSHFRAKSLTNMNSMFGGCSSLTSLDLSGFFTFTVTNMNYLFSGCTNLKTIYVNKYDWSTESVTAGDGVFENCTSLVGGAGTTFNDSHIDYTYARIDGGPNSTTPGYFTDKDATSKVATPTFSWNEHTLTVSSATEGATIVYNNLKENPVMVEGEGILLYQTYTYTDPLTIIENAELLFWAQKDGMANSDSITLNYPYTAWVALTDTLTKAKGIYDLALNNANVPDQMKSELASAISVGDSIYQVRNSSVDEIQSVTNRISVIANEVASLISAEDEPYAVLSDNDTVLTFYYDKQKTARGGIDINTRSWDIENGETPPYGGITKAVFDASFANYRPTSTDYWFQGCRNMTTVEGMENLNTSNVTSMWAMFDWCGSLESIDLSHMVTSNAVYLAYMFNGCSSLRSLDVSGFSTEKATDIGAMFRYCSKLTTVDVSHFNTSKVTSFWGLFAECSSLTSLDVSNFNTGQAENMAYMFYDCNQLQSLNVSNFNTSNVIDMLGMFGGCSSLTSLDLSSFNTQNVTNMTAMFYGCSGLTSLNLSGFNTSNVTDMQNMFSGRDMYSACRSLTSLDLSSFNTEKVTDMHGMFSSCSNLTTLDLTNFTTPKVRDFTNMFIGCEALETIYCENNWDSSSLDDQGTSNNMFYGLTKLKGGAGTTYSDEHTGPEYARVDGGPNSTTPGYFTDKNAPITVAAPEFRFEGDNVTMTTETQNASIFYKVAELPSMDDAVVESVVNSLIVTADGQSTYYDQPFELKKAAVVKAIAIIRNETATFVSDTTTMVYDYEAWVNLKAAVESGTDLYGRAQGNPNVDTQLLEDLQWALNEGDMIYNQRAQMDSFEATHFTQRINELCAQIEAQMAAEDEPYAVLSDNNTVLTFYYDKQKSARGGMSVGPFSYYNDTPWFSTRNTITTVEIDSSFVNCISLTSTAYWFADLQYLTTITGIGYLKTDNVKSMAGMFLRCHSLPSIDVSGFNTANVTTMEAMFYECQSLTTLDVSALNTSKVTTMEMMFQSCTNLTTLDVSTFNTSSLTNMLQMFCKCSGLTTLTLGNFNTDKVTAMSGLFGGCSSLTNIDVSSINTSMVDSFFLMFDGCSSLTTLDLSNFNSAHVSNMVQMFYGCTNLTSIYVGSGWTTSEVTSSENMFLSCTNLRGGAGTTYDENHVDVSYAHIDGGEGNPGYLTDKNPVEVSYYDNVLYVSGSTTLAEAMQKFGTNNVVETIAAIVWNSSQAISTSELQVITNPNLLIYVQDASLAPANRDNVVINGFAKNVVLSDVTSGNNNFYCPEEFTAEAISYTRNFQQQTEIGISRGWESIALPFDVQTIMHEKNGVLSPFGSSEGGKPFWLRQLSDNGLVQAIEIHANRPYLISMPNSTDYPAEFNQPGRVTFSSLNVRVPVTEEEAVAMADSTIVLIPTFQRMEQSDWIYALNVGETRAQYPEGSVFEQGLRAVRPFEAFTVHNNNQSNPAPRYIAINEIGNGTTGIENIVIKDVNALGDRWYSLDGRLLQGKPAQKGIYIHNGKKKIIK